MDYNNRRYIPNYRARSPSPRRGRSPSPSRRHFRSPSPRWAAHDIYTPGAAWRNRSPPRIGGGDSYVPVGPSGGGIGTPGSGPRRRLRSRSPVRRSRSPGPPRYRPRSRSNDRRRRFSRSRSPAFRRMRSRSPAMRRPRSPFRRSRSPGPFMRRRPSLSPGRKPTSPSPRKLSPKPQRLDLHGETRNLQSKTPDVSKPNSRRSSPPPPRSHLPLSSATSPSPRSSIAPTLLPSRPLSPSQDQLSKPYSPELPAAGSHAVLEKAVLVGTHSARSPVAPANQPSPQANNNTAHTPPTGPAALTAPSGPSSHRPAGTAGSYHQRSPPRGPAAGSRASPHPVRTASPASGPPTSAGAPPPPQGGGGHAIQPRNNSPLVHGPDNGAPSQPSGPKPPFPRAPLHESSASPSVPPASSLQCGQNLPQRIVPGSGAPPTAPRGPASQIIGPRDSYGRPSGPGLQMRTSHHHQPPQPQPPVGPNSAPPPGMSRPTGPPPPLPTQPRNGIPPTAPRNMVQGGIPTGPRSGGHPYRPSFGVMPNQGPPMVSNGGSGGGSNGGGGGMMPQANHGPVVPQGQYRPAGPNMGVSGPHLIPGGRLLPPISVEISDKLARLKVDQVRLEEEHRTIQERKRKSLMEWDKLERELASHTYRVELAEKQLLEMSTFNL